MCSLSTRNLCPSAQTVTTSKLRKITTVKQESGPKIEIEIETEETATLNTPKEEPASPCLSAVSSLTPEPESD